MQIIARVRESEQGGGGGAITLGLLWPVDGRPILYDGCDLDPNLTTSVNALLNKVVKRFDLNFIWSTVRLDFCPAVNWHTNEDARDI